MSINLTTAEANEAFIKAASIIREQQEEILSLKAAGASSSRSAHAEKIASAAVERGIMDPEDAVEYAQSLFDGGKDLDMIEEFVSRTAAGIPLGGSLKKTASVSDFSEDGDILTNFLLTNDIP